MPERIRLQDSSHRNHRAIVRPTSSTETLVNRLSTGEAPPAPFRSSRERRTATTAVLRSSRIGTPRDDPALLRSTPDTPGTSPVARGTFGGTTEPHRASIPNFPAVHKLPDSWRISVAAGRFFMDFDRLRRVELPKNTRDFYLGGPRRRPRLGKTSRSPASSLIIPSYSRQLCGRRGGSRQGAPSVTESSCREGARRRVKEKLSSDFNYLDS